MGKLVVSNVSKAYKRYPGKWARIREWITGKPCHEKTWVLRDISFTINPGEAVGIVGVNGAGKSTLLKIITGTTQPTSGSVQITGRAAALLELGMGFHPDFTGRQNVFMAGQLLGYGLEELAYLMPEIEAFAGIGEYIDRPVRVYSSGMQVRLAFAVSTAVRPDVLIVDEALSVGDVAFQRKCFRRIEDYQSAGMTLVFVSHDIEVVKKICKSALFINNGKLEAAGDAKTVCDAYERKILDKNNGIKAGVENNKSFMDSSLMNSAIELHYGNGNAEISEVFISDGVLNSINVVSEGDLFFVNYKINFKKLCRGVNFGMMIKSVDGVCVYGSYIEAGSNRDCFNEGEVVVVKFQLKGNLMPGNYYLNVGVTQKINDDVVVMHRRVDVMIFRVIGSDSGNSMGLANLFAAPVFYTP